MSKRHRNRIRKLWNRHNLTHNKLYVEIANSTELAQEHYISQFRNPLDRAYVRARIEEEILNLALTRLEELDPVPFIHLHDGCAGDGLRSNIPHSEDDEFRPRAGYISNFDQYDFN